jgi:hypothetical protein
LIGTYTASPESDGLYVYDFDSQTGNAKDGKLHEKQMITMLSPDFKGRVGSRSKDRIAPTGEKIQLNKPVCLKFIFSIIAVIFKTKLICFNKTSLKLNNNER